MLLIYNLVGLFIGVAAFALGALLKSFLGLGDDAFVFLVCFLALIFDLAYRFKSENGHLVSPRGGGSFFFLPVWGLATAVLVMGIVNKF